MKIPHEIAKLIGGGKNQKLEGGASCENGNCRVDVTYTLNFD